MINQWNLFNIKKKPKQNNTSTQTPPPDPTKKKTKKKKQTEIKYTHFEVHEILLSIKKYNST